MATWFEFDPDRTLPENVEEFLDVLRQEAAAWTGADPLDSSVYDSLDGYVVLGLDVVDRQERCVLRSLRADYGPRGLECGEDETHQFTTDLTSACAEYIAVFDQNLAPAQLARTAARWLRMQMIRPIEILEWRDRDYRLRKWRLADSRRALCWSASDNTVRDGLGEPHTISPVRTSGARENVGASAQQAVADERPKTGVG